MNDKERFEIVERTALWHAPHSVEVATTYFPKEVDDADGELFSEYFDFIQSLFSFYGYYKELTSEEMFNTIRSLKGGAKKFGYPTKVLDFFAQKGDKHEGTD